MHTTVFKIKATLDFLWFRAAQLLYYEKLKWRSENELS